MCVHVPRLRRICKNNNIVIIYWNLISNFITSFMSTNYRNAPSESEVFFGKLKKQRREIKRTLIKSSGTLDLTISETFN